MKALTKRIAGKRLERRLAVAAAVALFLIAAETYAAWHGADLEAHSSNGLCNICLTISGFAHSNVSHAVVECVPTVSPECVPATSTVFSTRELIPQQARGPPIPF